MKKTLIFAVLILFITTGTTYASTIAVGVPVGSIGSTTEVGIVDSNGKIKFYIPLSSTYSGVYGMPKIGIPFDIGEEADSGGGVDNALIMFLMYKGIDYPAATAVLKFDFTDLDLEGANDPLNPYEFWESIQIFDKNGAVTPLISDISDSNGDFDITVDSFGEVSITIDDFTSSVLGDPTYAKLIFSSDYQSTGTNTAEYLYTTLETSPVPIPGAVWLLGSGLLGLAGIRRKVRG